MNFIVVIRKRPSMQVVDDETDNVGFIAAFKFSAAIRRSTVKLCSKVDAYFDSYITGLLLH